jgi:WD40 repeat protein
MMKPTAKRNHGRQLSLGAAWVVLLTTLPVSAQEPKLRATFKPSGSLSLNEGLAVSKDGTLLAGYGIDQGKHKVKLWDAATGEEKTTLLHPGNVYSVAFSPDGKSLATGCQDLTAKDPGGWLKLWDVATGKEKTSLKAHDGFAWTSQFSGDGTLLASRGVARGMSSGHDREEIKLWEVGTWRVKTILNGVATGAHRLALSSDGKILAYLVYSDFDRQNRRFEIVKIRDLAKSQDKTVTKANAVALSGDSKLLVTWTYGADNAAKLWDVATGQDKATLQGHTGKVTCVAFKGNDVLASGSVDKTVKLWDAVTGREKSSLKHAHEVYSIAFSGDGRLLVSGGNGAVTVWEMPVTKTGDK